MGIVFGALLAGGGLITMGVGAFHDVATAGTAGLDRSTRMVSFGGRF